MANHILLNLDALPLLQTVAFWRTPKPFIHQDRTLPFHVMIYLVQGSMQIIEDGTEYLLTPNSLIFLKGGIHHWGSKYCAPDTTWYYIHFFLPQEHSYPLITAWNNIQYDRVLIPDDYKHSIPIPKILTNISSAQIENKLRHLTNLFHNPRQLQLPSFGPILYDILMECVRYAQIPFLLSPENDRIRCIATYLEAHIGEALNTSLFSAYIGLSYKHAGTLFKSKTGKTILEYHTTLRMNEAARLLRETSLTVSEISELLGYSELFYFSNVFKKIHMVSPRDYRKKIITN